MRLEVGKFYKAANGTKVGPMRKRKDDGKWLGDGLDTINAAGVKTGHPQVYNDDGSVLFMKSSERDHVLLEEWSDEVTFKVGDKVRVVTEHSGQLTFGKIYEVHSLNGPYTRVICDDGVRDGFVAGTFELVRASPVTTQTITRNSVVPGVYGRLSVRTAGVDAMLQLAGRDGVAEGPTHVLTIDELTELHTNIGLIINAMRNPEVVG